MRFDIKEDGKRILMVCVASLIMALNIKTFVRTGGRALSFRGDALSGKWKYLRNTDGHQRLCKPGRNDPSGKKQS